MAIIKNRGRARAFAIGMSLLAACTSSIDGKPAWHEPGGGGASGDGGAGAPGEDDPSRPGGGPGGGDSSVPTTPAGNPVFEVLQPAAYLTKVKSMLTGLPPTDGELNAVQADPAALKRLIADWQQTPEYEARMVDFFTTAFQQGDVTAELINNVTSFQQGYFDARVIQNMRESFGRTAMQLVKEGAPFTDVLTTRRFMLTPALMVAMAWLDERQSGDGGGINDALNNKLGPNAKYIMQADRQIPLADSVNPQSPDYLTFYAPQVAALTGDCRKPVLVNLDDRFTLYTATTGETMMMFFMGQRLQRNFCVYEGRGILDPADFTTWRMMTIRKPRANEERTWVYEIPKFRTANELVFVRPYVGFYTTPAFLYTWQTNTSNQARVTANQTLITALGRQFDGTLSAVPVSEAAVATEHARPGSDCYNCHVTMDPMRQFFRNTYSYYYGLQEDRNELNKPGIYAFDGESRMGSNIADLGVQLASSRRFAIGWTHKLCTWANGAVCDPTGDNKSEPSDPELLRIITAFRDSNHNWNTLVQELFSSPLVTYAAETETTKQRGVTFPVAKRAHLCQMWNQRLGLQDVCGLRALPTTASGDPVKTIATVLPSDSYSRGQTLPTLANDPGLFFYAGVENICAALAGRVVDGAGGTRYRSSDPDVAIADLVHGLMALRAPRDAEPIALLKEHLTAARAAGANDAEALRSTFILACMAPSAVSIGQ